MKLAIGLSRFKNTPQKPMHNSSSKINLTPIQSKFQKQSRSVMKQTILFEHKHYKRRSPKLNNNSNIMEENLKVSTGEDWFTTKPEPIHLEKTNNFPARNLFNEVKEYEIEREFDERQMYSQKMSEYEHEFSEQVYGMLNSNLEIVNVSFTAI